MLGSCPSAQCPEDSEQWDSVARWMGLERWTVVLSVVLPVVLSVLPPACRGFSPLVSVVLPVVVPVVMPVVMPVVLLVLHVLSVELRTTEPVEVQERGSVGGHLGARVLKGCQRMQPASALAYFGTWGCESWALCSVLGDADLGGGCTPLHCLLPVR
jgi:hypothetical protein